MTNKTIYHTAYDRTPFAYRIKWSKFNISYIGIRYAKNCTPSDLWLTYFTSSKGPETIHGHSVESFRKIHGEPDIIEIRKTFSDVLECRRWEARALKKLKVKTGLLMLDF